MSIQQSHSEEAYEELKKDPEALYLDVRSVPEFEDGHPAGSINIPILHKTEMGTMEFNQDFVKVVLANIPKDKRLFVGCLRGGRSQQACQILEQQGYTNLSNVHGGYGGVPDQQGWQQLDLPISMDSGEGVSYASLKAKVE